MQIFTSPPGDRARRPGKVRVALAALASHPATHDGGAPGRGRTGCRPRALRRRRNAALPARMVSVGLALGPLRHGRRAHRGGRQGLPPSTFTSTSAVLVTELHRNNPTCPSNSAHFKLKSGGVHARGGRGGGGVGAGHERGVHHRGGGGAGVGAVPAHGGPGAPAPPRVGLGVTGGGRGSRERGGGGVGGRHAPLHSIDRPFNQP